MNKRAAQIAWYIAMEHNAIYKGLTPVVHPKDDDEYNAAKKRFYNAMYRLIVRIMHSPSQGNDSEFLFRMLDEERPDSRPEYRGTPMSERLRDLFYRVRNFLRPYRNVPKWVSREDILAKAREMKVNPPTLNEACAEIVILQDRIRVLENALRNAAIELA